MADQTKQIHVVGSIDTKDRRGRIRYVNPTTAPALPTDTDTAAGPTPQRPPGTGVELVVEDADGNELQRVPTAVLLPSDASDSTAGLIDQRIVPSEGMAKLKLLYDGTVVDTFEPGAPPPELAAAAGPAEISMGAFPGAPAKPQLDLAQFAEPEAGVSYTVQVKPEGGELWQTVAVGRPTPNVVIDANQFPGAQNATVRVLRSTGFDDDVVAEGDVDLSYEN
jgi:hypothetical protein